MPRVSVGIPVYNGERYIAQSIDSILGQTFGDLELIISDNASIDGTPDICHEYERLDARVRYVRQPINLGGPANFRAVFALGRCEFYKWTTADDHWAPDYIENAVTVLDAHSDVVLCYSKTCLINADGQLIEYYDGDLQLLHDSPRQRFKAVLSHVGLCHAALGVIRRSAMCQTRLMTDEQACDINFLAELSLYGKFWLMPEYSFFRRLHPESSSWDMTDEAHLEDYYDPQRSSRFALHTWRKYARLFGAVARSPIPAPDKVNLAINLIRRMNWERQEVIRDLGTLFGLASAPSRSRSRPSASDKR